MTRDRSQLHAVKVYRDQLGMRTAVFQEPCTSVPLSPHLPRLSSYLQLYDFNNLTGFALTFKPAFYAQHWALSRGK